MINFKAFVVENKSKMGIKDIDINSLDKGNVTVKVSYSSFNFKDGLAISGKIPIFKKYPMIPGVDFSGTVIESKSKLFRPKQKVILNGWGVGEKHTGGFSQIARVKSDWLINLPKKITEKQAMIIGSAGYTAALCVLEIKKKLKPKDGDIFVTGASGGVGSITINILTNLGYNVIALSAKDKGYLKQLGAKNIITREEYKINKKSLSTQKWAGCVDTVGGDILSNVLTEIKYDGIVASTGLAKSPNLNTTVFPFILRNITLSGVDCVYATKEKRIKAWKLIEEKLDFSKLNLIKSEKSLKDLKFLSGRILNGKIKGRTIINVNL